MTVNFYPGNKVLSKYLMQTISYSSAGCQDRPLLLLNPHQFVHLPSNYLIFFTIGTGEKGFQLCFTGCKKILHR